MYPVKCAFDESFKMDIRHVAKPRTWSMSQGTGVDLEKEAIACLSVMQCHRIMLNFKF
jgi:hypothetical protein